MWEILHVKITQIDHFHPTGIPLLLFFKINNYSRELKLFYNNWKIIGKVVYFVRVVSPKLHSKVLIFQCQKII